MQRFFRFKPYLLAFALAIPFSAFTCGYDYIGGCSSGVSLSINGTADSFNLSACSVGLAFDGLHLGSLASLHLSGARAITWESCVNHVVGVALLYRIYEEGQPAGVWQSLALNSSEVVEEGPYTTRYFRADSDIDLCIGLAQGTLYVVELFLRADIDTIGDDYIAETTLLKNNGGQNFKMQFLYGGSVAPPFVLLPVLMKEPDCAGDSSGAVGIHVYGQQDVFYNWSGPDANFWALNDIPAGVYAVTVTNADGYQASDTFLLNQPDAVQVLFNVNAATAVDVADGELEAIPWGGTPPYTYLWSQGDTSAFLDGLIQGQYCVQVSDSAGCAQMMCVLLGFATDITELCALLKLNVYPNPLPQGQNIHVSISVPDILKEGKLQYAWINYSGAIAEIQQIKADSALFSIPSTTLLPGLWILRFEYEKKYISIPVVIH